MKYHHILRSGIRARIASLALFSLVALAPSATAQEYYCLPTCSSTDGRFLSLCGSKYKSIAGDQIAIKFSSPNTTDSLTFEIFDGETGGVWDGGSAPLQFVLFADPNNDGSGTTRIGSWSGANMRDTAWYRITIAHDTAARARTGAYFYVLKIRIATDDAGDSIDSETATETHAAIYTWSNFKVRSTSGISTTQFAFCAPMFSSREANIIYPLYPLTLNPTYDGTWSLFVQVPRTMNSFEVWDGDMDFGSFDGLSVDTDDANTSGGIVPRWAGLSAVNEGVAVGTDFVRTTLGVLTGILGTGSPMDDNLSLLYRRSPSVYYDIIDPNGRVYRNSNPSGNGEWERFLIGRSTNADEETNHLPRGVYEVRITGMDMHNANSWRYSEGIVGVTEEGTAQPVLVPDCQASERQFARGSASKSSLEISEDGEAYTWGDNCVGQLGDGSLQDRDVPVKVLKGDYPGTTYLGDDCNGIAVAAISHFRMVVAMQDGLVYSWGRNTQGELGVGSSATEVTSPKRVLKGDYPGQTYLGDKWHTPIERVAAGNDHALAVSSKGIVYAWGNNGSGAIGDNSTTNRTAPVRVKEGAYSGTHYLGDNKNNPIVDVVAGAGPSNGNGFSVALAADGTLYSWGYNGSGQLGDGTATNRLTPVRVLKGAYSGTTYLGDNSSNPVVAIAAMPDGCMALTRDGTVFTWGRNNDGELGDNTTTERRTPIRVLKGEYPGTTYLGDSTTHKIVGLAPGGIHSFVLTERGHLYAWGKNAMGALGDSTTTNRLTPVRIKKGEYPGRRYLGDSIAITSIGAGIHHSLALTGSNEKSYAWGDGTEGRLGEADVTDRRTPIEVAEGARSISNQGGQSGDGPIPSSSQDDSDNLSIDNLRVPTNADVVYVTLNVKEDVELGINLFDAGGDLLSRPISHEYVPAGVHKIALRMPANIPSGLYFVEVSGSDGNVTKQFLLTR